MAKKVLWFSLGTLTVVLLAFAWLWFADLGVFKPQVERFVSDKTGREFSINGNLSIDLARTTIIVAEDVRLGNADWADDPNMLTIGRVELRVNLRSLFDGPIIVELLDVDDVDLRLLDPEGQDPNWLFPRAETVDDEVVDEPVDEQGADVLLASGFLDNVYVLFDSSERDRPLELQVNTLRHQVDADNMLQTEVDALLNGRVVKVDGDVGPWSALLSSKGVRFDIEATLDTLELTGSGRIDDLVSPTQPEFRFSATAPDVNDVLRLLGLDQQGQNDVNLVGQFARNADGLLFMDVEGNFGLAEIDGTATVSDLKSFDNIDIELDASAADLGRVLRVVGIHNVRDAPFSIRIDAETEGESLVIREADLRVADASVKLSGEMPAFPAIDDARLELAIEGQDIARFRYITGMPGFAEGPFFINASVDVDDDGVEILELDADTPLARVKGTGRLGPAPDFLASRFELTVDSDSLAQFGNAVGIDGLPDYPVQISGAAEYVDGGLQSLGPLQGTVDEVSATVDGIIRFTPGLVDSDVSFALKGPDIDELVSAFTGDAPLPIEPYDLRGQLLMQSDGYRFRNVTGDVGSSAVELDGLLTTARGLAGTQFRFSAQGDAFEDVVAWFGDVEVREGPYRLTGNFDVQADRISLQGIELQREAGQAAVSLGIGRPLSDRQIEYDVRIDSANVQAMIAEIGPIEFNALPVSLVARGALNGSYLEFDEFNLGVGDAQVTSYGTIDVGDGERRSIFHTSGDIPSLAALLSVEDRQLVDRSIRWSANLAGGFGDFSVENLVATIDDSTVSGKIYYRRGTGGNVPQLDVTLSADSLEYAPLFEEPEDAEQQTAIADGRLMPDLDLPLQTMQQINATLDVDFAYFKRKRLELRDVKVDAELRDGILDVSDASFLAPSGAVRGNLRIEPEGETARASLQLVGRQVAFGLSELNQDLSMTNDLDISLEGTGADFRTLMANATGEFFMFSRGGRVRNNWGLQALYGNSLQEILAAVNPFRKSDPYTDFRCIVLPLRFDNGVVTGAPEAYIASSKIRILLKPSIDFNTEKVRVSIRTRPQGSLSISAGELVNPFVQIVGTLDKPRLAVDEKGILITGGAAAATGGLSILASSLWDRLSRSKTPCKDAAEKAYEELGGRFPALPIEGYGRIE